MTQKERFKVRVKNVEEMLSQIKLLLSNGYDVAIHKEKSMLGGEDCYLIVYTEPKTVEMVGEDK